MENTSKTTAKDFFLYIGIFIGLYVSVTSFLVLAFQILDNLFPLVGEYVSSGDGLIRSSIAALVIFFPGFLYLSYLANKDLKAMPEKKNMWVRRWAIFFTLFAAGLTIAIDLVTLVYRFLGAEDLTLRFFLKVFFVLAVAIAVFRSTLADLRRTTFDYDKKIKIKIILVSIISLAMVVYGVAIIGLPGEQQAKMFDAQRINDLENIQNQIVYTEWQNKGTVPDSLSALNDPISGFTVPTDPRTGAEYDYTKMSKNSFELCATFETVAGTSTANGNVPAPALYPDPTMNQNWQHGIGNVCFTRTIDPTLYKVAPAK